MPVVRFFVLIAGVIVFVAGNYAGSSRALQAEQNVQTIQVSAKKYDFTPSPIHVKQGATVRLRLTATDRAHGFEN